jgi:hypothetical protein
MWKLESTNPGEIFSTLNDNTIKGPKNIKKRNKIGLTKPLTELSTRNILMGKKRLERKADNLTAICELIV